MLNQDIGWNDTIYVVVAVFTAFCIFAVTGEWTGKTAGGSAKPMRRGSVSKLQKDSQVNNSPGAGCPMPPPHAPSPGTLQQRCCCKSVGRCVSLQTLPYGVLSRKRKTETSRAHEKDVQAGALTVDFIFHDYCNAQEKMKDSLRRESVVNIQDDGDPYWFNNPQYRLTVDEPAEVGGT